MMESLLIGAVVGLVIAVAGIAVAMLAAVMDDS